MVDNKFLPFYKKGQRMAAAGNSFTGLNAFLQRPFPPGEAEDAYLAGFYPETVIPKSPKVTHERIIRSAKMPPNPTKEETLSRIENGMISGKGISADDYDYYSSIYGPEVADRYLSTLSEYNWTSDQAVSSATPEEIAAYQASRSAVAPQVSVPVSAPAAQSAPDYNSMSFGQAFNAARKAGLSEFSWRDKGRFNTRWETEESPVQVATQAATAPVKQTPAEVQVPVQTAPTMQRQPVATGYGSGLPSGNALVQGDPRLREIYARIRAENAAKQAATAMASGL